MRKRYRYSIDTIISISETDPELQRNVKCVTGEKCNESNQRNFGFLHVVHHWNLTRASLNFQFLPGIYKILIFNFL